MTNNWRSMCSFQLLMWWTEKPPEICRASYRNKLWDVACCWLYSANILAMHGAVNVKYNPIYYCPSVCAWHFKVVFFTSGFPVWTLYAFIFPTQDTELRQSDYRVHRHIWQEQQIMKVLSVIFLLRSLFSKILSLSSSLNARGNVLYHVKGHRTLWFLIFTLVS